MVSWMRLHETPLNHKSEQWVHAADLNLIAHPYIINRRSKRHTDTTTDRHIGHGQHTWNGTGRKLWEKKSFFVQIYKIRTCCQLSFMGVGGVSLLHFTPCNKLRKIEIAWREMGKYCLWTNIIFDRGAHILMTTAIPAAANRALTRAK